MADIIDAFEDASCETRYSETTDSDPMANPIYATINGTDGGTVEIEIYLKNVSSDNKLVSGSVDIVNPSSAITYELALASSNDADGTPGTYQSPPLSLPNDMQPGDIVKIFLKQTVASGTSAQDITSHNLHISGDVVPV
jgi:hypothetical protein